MPSVLTIGNFDGVHLGHAALIARARQIAERSRPAARVVAMVFHPHPLTILRPDAAPTTLTTIDHRAELLRAAGADDVVQLHPTPELLNLSPEQFIDAAVREHAPIAIVEGPDFHFGKGRAGDNATLAALGRSRGFETHVVDPVEVPLSDQSLVTISSTLVRWLLSCGRVADAAALLGRPYELRGTVVRGDQRGREIGCPTANLSTPTVLPADAVYAGIATLADHRTLPAAIHVGTRSTFNDTTRTVEAHLLDWRGPLAENAPEYGWPLRLSFTHWLRDQARFDSVTALVQQINRDIQRTRDLIGHATKAPAA
jgi:riboflavin kinase/FMN adenylyltransferase